MKGFVAHTCRTANNTQLIHNSRAEQECHEGEESPLRSLGIGRRYKWLVCQRSGSSNLKKLLPTVEDSSRPSLRHLSIQYCIILSKTTQVATDLNRTSSGLWMPVVVRYEVMSYQDRCTLTPSLTSACVRLRFLLLSFHCFRVSVHSFLEQL